MKLSKILTEARSGAFIFKVAVKYASKVVANSKGELTFASTLFQRKHFDHSKGNEIVSSLNNTKETNITELENCFKNHTGIEMIISVGSINYIGIVDTNN